MFEHLQSVHKNDLDCIFCGKQCDHDIQLLDHISKHGQKIYCRVHFIAFDNSEDWLEHVSEPSHKLQCGICDKIFNTRSGRDNHRIHSHIKSALEKIKCPHCPLAYGSHTNMRRHVRNCHEKSSKPQSDTDNPTPSTRLVPTQEIKCPQCPLVYGSRTNLRRHVRTFHEKKVYLCEDCGTSFSTNQSLKHHTALRHNKGTVVGPIQCEYCGQLFRRADKLKAHKAEHFGQTEKCQYCGLFFESVEKLKEHVETLNHLLFQCDICSTTFKLKSHYLSHLMKLHNINLEDATNISMERKGFKMTKTKRVWKYRPTIERKRKPNSVSELSNRPPRGSGVRADIKFIDGKRHYVCLVCQKIFKNNSNLARHRQLHSDVKKFECHICNKTFSQKQGLHKHMPVHHDERPFECKVCGKRYKDSCTLGKHRRIHEKSALIGINSVSLNPRKKKSNPPKAKPLEYSTFQNPSYYDMPLCPQNYVVDEHSAEGSWFSKDDK